jgi:hypothetical protein
MKLSKLKSIKPVVSYQILAIISATYLTACGGSGGSSGNGGGGGGSDLLNIKSIATLSGLNTTYSPSCIYLAGTNNVYLVNGDGSGTGYNLNTSTGAIIQASGLPQINIANGDRCLNNYQTFTWVNEANPYLVHIYNPNDNTTVTADLSQAGIIGSLVSNNVSFAYVSGTLTANSNFSGNNQIQFSQFTLPNPSSYVVLNNSQYSGYISSVLYGFNGDGNQWQQLAPANSGYNLPAAVIYEMPQKTYVTPIVDSNNQAITAMSAVWDWTGAGTGIVVTSGLIQPTLYYCPLTNKPSYQCVKSYTSSDFAHKYKILRLLGGNATTIYFMGIDLTKSDVEIFSMPL